MSNSTVILSIFFEIINLAASLCSHCIDINLNLSSNAFLSFRSWSNLVSIRMATRRLTNSFFLCSSPAFVLIAAFSVSSFSFNTAFSLFSSPSTRSSNFSRSILVELTALLPLSSSWTFSSSMPCFKALNLKLFCRLTVWRYSSFIRFKFVSQSLWCCWESSRTLSMMSLTSLLICTKEEETCLISWAKLKLVTVSDSPKKFSYAFFLPLSSKILLSVLACKSFSFSRSWERLSFSYFFCSRLSLHSVISASRALLLNVASFNSDSRPSNLSKRLSFSRLTCSTTKSMLRLCLEFSSSWISSSLL